MPGAEPGSDSGLTQPLVLPESLRQRIRAVLDDADDEAPQLGNGALSAEPGAPPGQDAPPVAEAPQQAVAPAERPASLPRRVPGANNAPGPPAHIARAAMLPSLVYPPPEEIVAAVPAATLGAIAAAGGTLSGAAAQPEAAAPAKAAQPDAAAPPGPATVPAPEPQLVVAPRAPAEECPGRPDQRDGKTVSPEQETASRDELPSEQKGGEASLGQAQLHGASRLARRPGESTTEAPVPPPTAAPPKFAPPESVPPQPAPASPEAPALPPGRPGRSHRLIGAVMLLLLVAVVFLLHQHGNSGKPIAPTTTPTAAASSPPGPRTEAEVRAATAAWVASQVSRADPISCDQAMCQALRAHGVPAADLMVLRPGGGKPLRSHVIVVTPTVTKMVGTEFLTADAPATIASFGSGSRQESVRVIYPQGAAAYAAALRQDIAQRKANEVTLLENQRVTAPPAARRQLQGGQVDSRLLLILGQLASQQRLSIVAFGDRGPGASPGVPLRSADLAVTGDAAARARQMASFAHQLQDFFASARIRAVRLANGQEAVQVAFAAPSPFGVLNR